jgi:hypothetical protein
MGLMNSRLILAALGGLVAIGDSNVIRKVCNERR